MTTEDDNREGRRRNKMAMRTGRYFCARCFLLWGWLGNKGLINTNNGLLQQVFEDGSRRTTLLTTTIRRRYELTKSWQGKYSISFCLTLDISLLHFLFFLIDCCVADVDLLICSAAGVFVDSFIVLPVRALFVVMFGLIAAFPFSVGRPLKTNRVVFPGQVQYLRSSARELSTNYRRCRQVF